METLGIERLNMGEESEYIEETLSCIDCQVEFAFTVGELEFFTQKGFAKPIRCASCVQRRRGTGRIVTEVELDTAAKVEEVWMWGRGAPASPTKKASAPAVPNAASATMTEAAVAVALAVVVEDVEPAATKRLHLYKASSAVRTRPMSALETSSKRLRGGTLQLCMVG